MQAYPTVGLDVRSRLRKFREKESRTVDHGTRDA